MIDDYQLIKDIQVEIRPEEVLRLQGCRTDRSLLKEDLQTLLRENIDLGYRLVKPQAAVRIYSAGVHAGDKLTVAGYNLSIGRAAKEWTGIKYLALAVCTIGDGLEAEVSRLFGVGEFAAALMLDSAGSAAVESLADHVNGLVSDSVSSERLTTACRISPGYGDWPLAEQKILFELLPAGKIGVNLTGSYMMQPRKSVSFAVAAGDGFTVSGDAGRCRYCLMTACPYRVN